MGGRVPICMIIRDMVVLPATTVNTLVTIAPMGPAVIDVSIQKASLPFTDSLPTIAYSIVIFLPSAVCTSYCAPEPTTGFISPRGIEGPRPIIWPMVVAANNSKQTRQLRKPLEDSSSRPSF